MIKRGALTDAFEGRVLSVVCCGTELKTRVISGAEDMAKVVGRTSSEALPCGRIGIVTTSASDLTISRSLVSKGASGALLDAQFGSSVGIEESRACGI